MKNWIWTGHDPFLAQSRTDGGISEKAQRVGSSHWNCLPAGPLKGFHQDLKRRFPAENHGYAGT
jgi:hypothetical protein